MGDPWAAYLFDQAVMYFGTLVEGAAQEMKREGPDDKPRWVPKYTMRQLLDPEFTLPLTDDDDTPFDVAQFAGVDGAIVDEVT